jgi:hypothetical protein
MASDGPVYVPSSIGGRWTGTYFYSSEEEEHLPPVVFECLFTRPDESGHFTGEIHETDPLGNAHITQGEQRGDSLRFIKVYDNAPPGYTLAPIRYDGTLSPDGNRITGTWELTVRRLFGLVTREAYGIWQAERVVRL